MGRNKDSKTQSRSIMLLLLVLAIVLICALLYFVLNQNEIYMSETYTVELGAANEIVLISDFSHNTTQDGRPDGLWIKLVNSSEEVERPITFVLLRTEGEEAPEIFDEKSLVLNEEAKFQLPERLRFKYMLYAKSDIDNAGSISAKVVLNDYEVIT